MNSLATLGLLGYGRTVHRRLPNGQLCEIRHDAKSIPEKHQQVFKLIRDKKFADAARLAVPIINAGKGNHFFVYDGTPQYRRASVWFSEQTRKATHEIHYGSAAFCPAHAQYALERNPGNRRLDARDFSKRLADLSSGNWEETGETLIFSSTGELNDGQHRLWAVILTGITMKTGYAFGASRDSRLKVDTGGARTAAAGGEMRGIPDPKHKFACISLAMKMFYGREHTNVEQQAFYDENTGAVEFAYRTTRNGLQRGTNRAALSTAVLYLAINGAAEDRIKTFCYSLKKWNNLGERSPILALVRSITKGKAVLSREQWVRTFVAHFLLWNEGKSTSALRTPPELTMDVKEFRKW